MWNYLIRFHFFLAGAVIWNAKSFYGWMYYNRYSWNGNSFVNVHRLTCYWTELSFSLSMCLYATSKNEDHHPSSRMNERKHTTHGDTISFATEKWREQK